MSRKCWKKRARYCVSLWLSMVLASPSMAQDGLIVIGAPIPPTILDAPHEQGVYFDLFKLIAEQIPGLQLKFDMVPPGRVRWSLEHMQAPLIILAPGFASVPGNMRLLAPVWSGGHLVLLYRKALAQSFVSHRRMVGRTNALCAQLPQQVRNIDVYELNSSEQGMRMLDHQRLDAVCQPDFEIGYYLRRHNSNWSHYASPRPIAKISWSIYVNSQVSAAEGARIQRAIQTLREDGRLKQLFGRFEAEFQP